MAFQTACEAARAKPDKKVLVLDFSLYSDITALLLGLFRARGSARRPRRRSPWAHHPDTRAEARPRPRPPRSPGTDTDPASSRRNGSSAPFRRAGRLAGRALVPWISRRTPSSRPTIAASIPITSTSSPPPAPSPGRTQDDDDAAWTDGPGSEKPLWTRGGDAWWWPRKHRAAVARSGGVRRGLRRHRHLAACV